MILRYFCYDKDADTEYRWRVKPESLTYDQARHLHDLMDKGKLLLHNSDQRKPLVGSFLCDGMLFLFTVKKSDQQDVVGRPIYILEGLLSGQLAFFNAAMPYLVSKYFDPLSAALLREQVREDGLMEIDLDALIDETVNPLHKNAIVEELLNNQAQITTFSNTFISGIGNLFSRVFDPNERRSAESKPETPVKKPLPEPELKWCIVFWKTDNAPRTILQKPTGRIVAYEKNEHVIYRSGGSCFTQTDRQAYADAFQEAQGYLEKTGWRLVPFCKELYYKIDGSAAAD